jgi:hypothetical protein
MEGGVIDVLFKSFLRVMYYNNYISPNFLKDFYKGSSTLSTKKVKLFLLLTMNLVIEYIQEGQQHEARRSES